MVAQPPLCGCDLQRASKIVAIIDMVLAVINFILGIISGILVLTDTDFNSHKTDTTVLIAAYIVVVVIVLIATAQIVIAYVLLQGSKKRHLGKCRIWYIITIILLVFNILNFILNVSGSIDAFGITSSVIFILYHVYGLWIVYVFMDELKTELQDANLRRF